MSSISRQQNKIKEALKKLELNEKEIAIFLFLLEKDSATASQIAKALKSITRTYVYDIMKNLQNRGIITSVEQSNKTYFQIGNTEHIIDSLENKKQELTDTQNLLRETADIFKQIKLGSVYKPNVRFFEGREGMFAIHRELQNARKETKTIVNIAAVSKEFPMMFYADNLKDFRTYKIMKKDLMVKNMEAEKYLKIAPLTEFHKVKWLPEGTELQTDTLIWEGHTAIIDYTENLSGVVIDNPTIANTFSVWFNLIWNSISEEVKK